MDVIGGLVQGFSVALTPMNLLMCLVGCFLGTVVGVLPGLGPPATIAMLSDLVAGLHRTRAVAARPPPPGVRCRSRHIALCRCPPSP